MNKYYYNMPTDKKQYRKLKAWFKELNWTIPRDYSVIHWNNEPVTIILKDPRKSVLFKLTWG